MSSAGWVGKFAGPALAIALTASLFPAPLNAQSVWDKIKQQAQKAKQQQQQGQSPQQAGQPSRGPQAGGGARKRWVVSVHPAGTKGRAR